MTKKFAHTEIWPYMGIFAYTPHFYKINLLHIILKVSLTLSIENNQSGDSNQSINNRKIMKTPLLF